MHVLLIAPAHSGLLYIDAAKQLNVTVSIMTTNKGVYTISADIAAAVDAVIEVGAFEAAEMIDAAKKLHQTKPLDGVAAGYEFLVEATAQVAAALGLPGLDPTTVEAVRNKASMRQALQQAGVRTVKYATAQTAADLEDVARTVGFPAVVKPLDMAGSIGVSRVEDAGELLAAYKATSVDVNTGAGELGNDMPTRGTILVEEFLVGTEYCVDGYVTQDGTITVCEFIKVELGPRPHFQEIGYTSYRYEDLPHAEALESYICSVVKAVGITVGPFHSEVMLTQDGPVLIEIANRLPGDHLPLLTERATGVSFAVCALAALVGLPIPAPRSPIARVAASQFIIDPSMAGKRYAGLADWETIAGAPNVDEATYEIEPGQVVPVEQDYRSRIAEIMYHADSVEVAEVFRQTIVETLRVVR